MHKKCTFNAQKMYNKRTKNTHLMHKKYTFNAHFMHKKYTFYAQKVHIEIELSSRGLSESPNCQKTVIHGSTSSVVKNRLENSSPIKNRGEQGLSKR